ncbi:molybdopterin-dependent oxidoreductase [Sphingorhabdus contaminans]|uniref:Molybdopterin-dependent oxidoreductase n=1 Tax=Sphingorhabdus contaminans TaxID=1343899 RepID=A0A553WCF9_9SPHN|nr:molybdopterin-dependent oxidoreductase [Sphingorhabdus contaminans]
MGDRALNNRKITRLCPFCEACCGLVVEVNSASRQVISIKGDKDNPFSKGFLCPKSQGLRLLEDDPDRLRRPLVRRGKDFVETDIDSALDEAATAIRKTREKCGNDALGLYIGNPVAHNLGLVIYGGIFALTLPSRNMGTAGSIDHIAKVVSSTELFGSEALIPVPDIDRTDYLLVIGANPMVSNGSLVTAPGWPRRLEALRARGGKLVVIDPRRSETAEVADSHIAIQPGSDVFLLLALVNVLYAENLVSIGTLADITKGVDDLRNLVAPFSPASVAEKTGVDAEVIHRLAREIAKAKSAVAYGRIGTTAQKFGTLTSWLIDVVNILTGNLDREGGAMFPLPVTPALIYNQTYVDGIAPNNRWRTRVKGLPEVSGFSPVATLPDEILTPGEGQIRAMLTLCGNPVRSSPNSARYAEALASLDFMASIDLYLNETTRFANVILPPSGHLEQVHYPPFSPPYMVRSYAKWDGAAFPEETPGDGELLLRLNARILGIEPAALEEQALKGMIAQTLAADAELAEQISPADCFNAVAVHQGPARFIDLLIRCGPFGDRFGARADGLTLTRLQEMPHGIDLGPMIPRLRETITTTDRFIQLVPPLMKQGLASLRDELTRQVSDSTLLLVGRRHLRSNNSWMHNIGALAKGPDRSFLEIHPDDARDRQIFDGATVLIRSRKGQIQVTARITDRIKQGVITLPHGHDHGDDSTRMSVAAKMPGANFNALTDEDEWDSLSGIAVLTGIPVEVALQ